MELGEYLTLRPYFTEKERYLNGRAVNPAELNYRTMYWLWLLRHYLKQPIYLIFNPRHVNTDRVDFCCPAVSLHELFLGLTRIPLCSWGLYSGGSAHLDCRSYEDYPARWVAIRPAERYALVEAGLAGLAAPSAPVTETGDPEWLYLPYTPACLTLVLSLAERNVGGRGGG